MKKHMGMIILALLVLGVFVTYTVAYSVDPTQWSLVTRFGRVLDGSVYNGATPGEGGLKFKQPYPIEARKTFEARIMMFEDPDNEMETKDKIVIRVTMYCTWRISDPVVFNRSSAMWTARCCRCARCCRMPKATSLASTPWLT